MLEAGFLANPLQSRPDPLVILLYSLFKDSVVNHHGQRLVQRIEYLRRHARQDALLRPDLKRQRRHRLQVLNSRETSPEQAIVGIQLPKVVGGNSEDNLIEIGDRGGPLRQHGDRPLPFRPPVIVAGEVREGEPQTRNAFAIVEDVHQLVQQFNRAAQFSETADDRFDNIFALSAIQQVVLRTAAQQPQRLHGDVSRHLMRPVEQRVLRSKRKERFFVNASSSPR